MLVCLCKGVSDKKIKNLLHQGVRSLRDVMGACQAGSDCGTCISHIRKLIDDQAVPGETCPARPASDD